MPSRWRLKYAICDGKDVVAYLAQSKPGQLLLESYVKGLLKREPLIARLCECLRIMDRCMGDENQNHTDIDELLDLVRLVWSSIN